MWPKQNKPYPKKAINSYTENQKNRGPERRPYSYFYWFSIGTNSIYFCNSCPLYLQYYKHKHTIISILYLFQLLSTTALLNLQKTKYSSTWQLFFAKLSHAVTYFSHRLKNSES